MQPREDLPPTLPLLLPAGDYDDVGNDRHALHNDSKAHQEAHGAPHGTEIAIIAAVGGLGEVGACVLERGAATVEAVGVVDAFAGGL